MSREVERLVNTIDRAMSKVKHDVEESPPGDPRRHAMVEGIRGSSKLENRVQKLFKYVVLLSGCDGGHRAEIVVCC